MSIRAHESQSLDYDDRMIPTTTLADGTELPLLGQGTWHIGDDPGRRRTEIAALRHGIEAGMTLVDTAEMYGSGRSEDLVGEAIAPVRDEVYLVDKVLPTNASESGTIAACERSLAVLGTDHIDLYLLHWPGPHPVEETIAAFESLRARGLIGGWGVSNFDPAEIAELPVAPLVNQVLLNPSRRGPEHDLLPAHRDRRPHITTMAYSPIEQGRLLEDPTLAEVARRHEVSTAQILLAWAMRSGDVIAIPKASTPDHVKANAEAVDIALTSDDLADIDRAFPAPTSPMPLEVI
ncbi:MAG: aldo/keto reductase [Brevibacterium aurantiacum]|uniref:Aldo/keto reductase n=2 Tax=Brevibacterium aurantiacum TaxID=273384 RepID=A0A2H1K5M7_BREAU|nr:aldo/keto reductase [Brevibacterium aurantiacum]AOP52889.1 Oxidoreductase, aldo/keto reductase family [Brevibacterium aurantiacum]SMX94996.1 Aldo/keto reductase [Brevibacterium aurantiacum]SMY03676.1 Aldo/keto reductase [Brevibacterium aurantiacum]